jgi:NTE family protein
MLPAPNPVLADDQPEKISVKPSNTPHDLSKPCHVDDYFLRRLSANPRGVVLALGGGGCKCVAEIGVLRSLEKHHVPIAGIIGTSSGATVGALYCSGMPLDEIEELYVSGEMQDSMRSHIALAAALHPFVEMFSTLHLCRPHAGFIRGTSYLNILSRTLPASFEGLKIPFAAVSTNLTQGYTTVLSHGSLPKAVLASNALPPFFCPVKIDNDLFLDGGLKANLPSVVAQQLSNNVVVAVTVDQTIHPVPNKTFRTVRSTMMRAASIMVATLDSQQAKNSDVLLYPNTDYVPLITKDEEKLSRAIAAGEAEADRYMPLITRQLAANTNTNLVR